MLTWPFSGKIISMDENIPYGSPALRLGLQQRLLPAYRAEFFDALAQAWPGGLSILAGQPRTYEAMGPEARLEVAHPFSTYNRYIFRGPLTLVWQTGWRDWLESWRPQALIVEANPRNLSNARVIRWMRAHGGAVIGWGLGAPPAQGGLSGLQRAWWARLLRQYDAIITYSRQGIAEYARLGFPAERIFVAPNAATRRPAQPPPVRPLVPTGQPVVLFVGRLQPRKRVDALIRACAALPAGCQPNLWIAGDGPALPELHALAAHLYPATHFLGDLRGPGLDAVFAAADLFVLPGTGGLAVQQAMAAGLPVIVAEADGTQMDLVRPENGWCLPAADFPALVATLSEALQDIPRLRVMGAASYRIVADEINVEAMVSVFLQAFAVLQSEKSINQSRRTLIV
jgi:glycosyltransferase involved in cell wall biosynthesis